LACLRVFGALLLVVSPVVASVLDLQVSFVLVSCFVDAVYVAVGAALPDTPFIALRSNLRNGRIEPFLSNPVWFLPNCLAELEAVRIVLFSSIAFPSGCL